MISDFPHQQHAHCESGVTVNLLKHEGVTISEPMVFGLGGRIIFRSRPIYPCFRRSRDRIPELVYDDFQKIYPPAGWED
jgi:hypothetical protein